jgi:hypothetical protein
MRSNSAGGRSPTINRPLDSQPGVPCTPFSRPSASACVTASNARSSRNALGRNVRVRLKRQLDEAEPASDEDAVAVLTDVAERTEEIVPVHYRRSGSAVLRGRSGGRL